VPFASTVFGISPENIQATFKALTGAFQEQTDIEGFVPDSQQN
jgi:hypothetical protein